MAPLPPLNRRGFLGVVGAGALVAGCGETSKKPPSAGRTTLQKTVTYGTDHPDQYGVLGLPSGKQIGLVILVHGGYWSDQYGLDLMKPMADDLNARGYATWNIEYRRIGNGGGFPATFTDVAAAYDKSFELGVDKDLPITAIGHSAGGQLAVWAQSRTERTPGGDSKIAPSMTISLSGVLDLVAGVAEDLGNGAVPALMGGGPNDVTYPLADPCQLVPAPGAVIAIHAEDDEIVPADQSTTYVRLDRAAGGTCRAVKVPGGHFDLIDPTSDAWKEIVKLL